MPGRLIISKSHHWQECMFFLPREEEAIGKSLGVPMSEDENGRFQGEGNGLFVHFVHNTVEIGTDQYLTRAIQ
jgi:hypothetical protein